MQHLFRHILVPLDPSPLSESALDAAVTLAAAFGARVTLLRVIEAECVAGEVQAHDPLQTALHGAQARAHLAHLAAGFRARGVAVETEVMVGDPAVQILACLREQGADLLVLCSHGQGGPGLWCLGGQAGKLLLLAHVSVLLVRPGGHDRPGPVLVPLDGSSRAEHALPVARLVAQARGTPVVLAHILTVPELPRHVPHTPHEQDLVQQLSALNRSAMERYLEDTAAHSAAEDLFDTLLLDSHHVVEALHDLIAREEIGLVVMSAHGHSGLRRWPYGSAALNLLTYAEVPVLIVQDLSPHEIGAGAAQDTRPPAGH
ncbi:universal stress protein [Deinococcus aerophilus]|uniref:Universal stress protein UspA n=1 Tax=Deinococcus aerophilus TaxID=522488 RepID=A0ABQ2GZ51_9DEIO|nr:universal stress protein [Deinococcus aerophilus]GGM19439.1 universal stress protein UspA [Deinococcus aerophilus]